MGKSCSVHVRGGIGATDSLQAPHFTAWRGICKKGGVNTSFKSLMPIDRERRAPVEAKAPFPPLPASSAFGDPELALLEEAIDVTDKESPAPREALVSADSQ